MNESVEKSLILSGSFNPLHDGHIGLLKACIGITNQNPFFEISISNVDKKNISLNDLKKRIEQFHNVGKLIITNCPTFEDKSNLFKKSIFAIGYDTAARLMDQKYYENNILKSFLNIKNNECSFIVSGRSVNGKYKDLSDINITGFKELFTPLPKESFSFDISSTELRKGL
jgi:nicotinic acid mononucleotide adenylyltransferase